MKKIKKAAIFPLVFLIMLTFVACGEKTDTEAGNSSDIQTESASNYIRTGKTKVASLGEAVGLGIYKFSIDRKYNYETTFYDEISDVKQAVNSAEADIAVLPIAAAAELCSESDGNVKILAVNSLGFFHILEKGEKIQSLADLKGKTVYAAYKGTTYESLINYIFSANGIDPEKDLDIRFAETNADASHFTDDDTAEIIIVPEPYASKILYNKSEYRKAVSLNDEWDKISDVPLAQSVVVARSEYIDSNPDIIKEFIGFNKISVNYTISNEYLAPVFLHDNGFCETVEIATEMISGCYLKFIDGADMKAAVTAVLSEVYSIVLDDSCFYAG